MSEVADRFKAYLLLVRKRSSLTVEAYLRELRRLEAYLLEGGKTVTNAKSEDILGYLVLRRQEGLSRTTMARLVSSLHSFFKYMKLEG